MRLCGKQILLLLLFVALLAPAHGTFAQCFPTPSGLIGWWPADGNANNLLLTNNGTFFGGASATNAGFVSTAFRFDGTNGYVQIPDSPILRPTNVTIEAWVKFDSLDSAGNAGAGQQYIVFKQNTRSGGFEGYNLAKTRIAGGDVFAFLMTSAAGELAEVQSTTLINTGVWYHVACVRGSNFAQLYVNGQRQAQATVTFPLDYGSFPLYFGTSGQSYWDRKFKGSLDEVSLYNRALSSNEISAVYTAGAVGKCKAPNITTPPLGQAVVQGTNATFSVAATGFGTLSYQWRFNGANIAGATATNYTRVNAQVADAGNYTVVITNVAGSVTSAVATLTVYVPPSVSVPPQSLAVNQGQNAPFSVTATGTAPLGYQWRFNGANIGGATASSYTRVGAQPADAGGYSVVVSNMAGSVTSVVASLTINIPPSIFIPPQDTTVNQGQNADFSVAANGTGPLAYQWRFNGANISSATASNYTRLAAQPADAGSYAVVITNVAGAITSSVATLTVNVPPSISNPPQGLTVTEGQNAAFSVSVSGTAPFIYQWRFNGVNIDGATASTYTRFGTQSIHAGGYSVVVANMAGSVTSIVASLTVNVPPSVSIPPEDLTVVQGQDATFSVTAAGTGPLSYQWQFNGVNISGATGSDYTRASAQASHAGDYSVVISNVAGSVTSPAASLTVNVPPSVSVPPQSLTVNQGQDAAFSVTAAGTAPLSYQWSFNGIDISGATASTYTRVSAQPGDVGGYSVVITNVAGSVTSAVASLSVNIPPSVSVPPQGLTVNQGQNAPFSVAANGTGPLAYQWRFNGVNISGATASDYTRLNAQGTDAGSYSVVITNVAGSTTSAVATLAVNIPPSISTPPQNLNVNQGQNASFNVSANGTGPLGYQWRFNGANISGATASDYTRVSAQPSDAGGYSVVVSNMAGSITSVVASLTVNIPPAISTPPQSLTVNQGQNAPFSVTATGTAPLGYQWRFNGANISGATASDYTRVGALPSDAGAYSVVVSNMAGSVTSIVASLSVNIPAGIGVPPQDLTVNQGQSSFFNVTATGTAPLTYQWRFNGANIGGATTSSYSRISTQPSDAGGYSVVVGNMAGSATSAVATLTVNIAPGISTPPQNLTVNQGQNAPFSVTATGTVPLTYQWRFNGTNISGATDSTYTRLNAQSTDAGNYSVVVSNMAGSVTSAAASLAVNVPPSVSVPPQNITVNQGQDAAFNVTATGTAPLGYQWLFNGTAISGATATSYTRVSAQPADAGGYSVVISNMAGSVTSIVASLSVNVPPSVSVPPQNLTVNQGQDATFNVTANGTAPLGYQWRFNGNSIGGATASSYTRASVQPADAGGYSVAVSNIAGSITSVVASLTVNVPPGISNPPQDLTVNQGQNATFNVTATGTAPLAYQWRFNGTNIAGATGTSYTRFSAQSTDGGGYSVVVTNVAGSITSAVASLTVNGPPTITAQPGDLTVVQNQNAMFNVTATGTAPLIYQWIFNGTNIGGAVSSSYTRTNAQGSDAGGYMVIITNVAGSITSTVASLTVNIPPSVSVPPQNLTVVQGQSAGFNVTAAGTAPLNYQWLFNGAVISGATASTYTRANAQASDAGSYAVVITNVAGSITSAMASLTVNIPPSISVPPQNLTVFQGQNAPFSVTAAGTAPLNYQWRFNGTNIAGANASNYTRTSAQAADAGPYSVVVGNVAGSITSSVAILNVNTGPQITAQPQSRTNVVGTTATFSISANGLQLAYQWRLFGTNLPGATDSSLVMTNVQVANAGNYSVVLTNSGGSATSSVAVLTIWVPPSISLQPQSKTNNAGTPTSFSVTAAGTAPLKYQWRFNGAVLSGATTSSISIANAQPGDAGDYQVVITNNAGSITSAVAALNVIGATKTWYVDNSAVGSANAGTNWANAWTNLNDIVWGVNGVKAGDTVYLSGGTSQKIYTNEWVIGASGTPGHPIRIAVDASNPSHNGRAIFDFNYLGDQGDATAITCLRDYVAFDGDVNGENHLVIANLRHYRNEFTALGIYAEFSTGVTIDAVTFTNCNDAVRFTSATGFRISRCEFRLMRGEAAIMAAPCYGGWDANVVCSNYFEMAYSELTPSNAPAPYYGPDGIQCGDGISIFANKFKEIKAPGIYTSKQHPDFIQAVGDHTKVYDNEFINVGDSAFDFGFYSGPTATGVWIYNNLFRIEEVIDAFPEFIRFYNGSLTLMSDIKIMNNTFADNNDWLNVRFENFGTPVGVGNELKNNIFVNCGNSTYKPVIYFDSGCSFSADSWLFDGNVFYHPSNQCYIYFGNSYPAWEWVSRFESTGKTNAPAFVNYVPFGTNNDFHLTAGDMVSVDTGVDLSSYFITSKDGALRPQGTGWDRGAFELVGGGYAYTNQAPVVSPITQNIADADASAPDLQVLRNTTVQYSASASDPDGNPISWQWGYSLNGGPLQVYQTGTGTVANINFNYGSTTAGNIYIWELRVSDGQKIAQSFLTANVITNARSPKALVFEAESGTLTGPFVISNGCISQLVSTAVTDGGRAVYNFVVTNAGQYAVQALVDAPRFGENSFLIDIDSEPSDPSAEWHVPVTLGFESHAVSWQGSGTCAAPQYAIKAFNLTVGAHQLIVRAKDANVRLDQLSILPLAGVTTSPATLVTATKARLNGQVNPLGAATTISFQYGTTTNYGKVTASQNVGSGNTVLAVFADASGLQPQTTYHFRLQASTASGTSYGDDLVFATVPAPSYTNGQFKVWTVTENGKIYYLEYITAIGNTNWMVAASLIGDGTPRVLVDPSAIGPQRFYRVRIN